MSIFLLFSLTAVFVFFAFLVLFEQHLRHLSRNLASSYITHIPIQTKKKTKRHTKR